MENIKESNNRTGSIYIIKNKINNKVYIGQTLRDVNERFKQHMKPSNSKYHYKIYRAINKYGAYNFYYEILEKNILETIIDEREIYWIEFYDSFKNGYNSNTGGSGRSIFKDIDVEYIINGLKGGKQIKELAEEFEVCTHTISRTLKKYGIKNPSDIQDKKIALGKAQEKVNRETVRELCKEDYNVKEISKKLNCNPKTIRRIKHELDIEMEIPRYDYSNISDEEIINSKLSGMKVKDILSKYNISYGYYYKIWKDYKNKFQNENPNDYPKLEYSYKSTC